MQSKLMEYFNKQPRISTLSSSAKDGRVDVAVLGSPHMVDENTVIVALGKNRTFSNLLENPNAVIMIMEPGTDLFGWKGIRVYLEMKRHETSGELLDDIRLQSSKAIGKEAAEMIHVAVTFKIVEVRPLIDLGQGWENSI